MDWLFIAYYCVIVSEWKACFIVGTLYLQRTDVLVNTYSKISKRTYNIKKPNNYSVFILKSHQNMLFNYFWLKFIDRTSEGDVNNTCLLYSFFSSPFFLTFVIWQKMSEEIAETSGSQHRLYRQGHNAEVIGESLLLWTLTDYTDNYTDMCPFFL